MKLSRPFDDLASSRGMSPEDPALLCQLPLIQKIIEDETWLEGERRGCPVPPSDPKVRENVCRVILRIGSNLRQSVEGAISGRATRSQAG